jgi:parallel beta-helix repeat protein
MVSLAMTVITVTNTQYLNFHNLGIFGSRELGIQIKGNYVQITNSVVANHGHYCIDLEGTNAILDNNIVYGCGCGGINVIGGVQKTLTPGSNIISNNEIFNYSRIVRTYNPGVNVQGVGHTIKTNYIYNAPHNGILTSGNNNCMFVGNHLKSLCFEATDCGALYTGNSWIVRGNVVRQNTFEDIYDTEKISLGWPSVQGVYLDDQMSGWVVEDNTFINCQTGILIGGGRRNNITNNIFTNCTLSIHFDNRGMNWQNVTCKPGGSLEQGLESVNYQHPPWSTAYPDIVNIMNEHPCIPVYNIFENNVYCETASEKFMDATSAQVQSWYSEASNNNPRCNKIYMK